MDRRTANNLPIENIGVSPGLANRPTNPFLTALVESCRPAAGDGRINEIADAIRAWSSPAERVGFAAAAIRALDELEAEMVAEAALADLRGGPPGAPFDSTMAEAWLWADMASAGELRAYVWAAFHKMPLASRQRFLAAVYADQHGKAAA